ncbi:MAG TPA: molybdopterin-dependent oxidoreductase [Candidatus Acidoferrales bacterium]|nr:molybdopterin-dependent oxidoreductase [Candidatus Acidoferrales bacterium]
MSDNVPRVSRRKLITRGLTAVAGVSGLGVAAKIADQYGLIPPDWGGVWGPGETLTYASQRILMSVHSMAPEFNRSEISKVAPVNGKAPQTDLYEGMRHAGFAEWRLAVDGLVARPSSFSLAELKSFPSRSQITHQACEEGWSFIAEWAGVPLSYLLNHVGINDRAKFVVFFTFDERWWGSLDLPDSFHPQTFLAYGMNGEDLPADHGAPLRVRVARQLGYKSIKYLTRITVTDALKNIGDGRGSSAPSHGFSWYAGI